MGTTTAYAREGSVEIVHWPSPVRFGTSAKFQAKRKKNSLMCTLLANFYLSLCVKFHISWFWVLIVDAEGPYWVLISQKMGLYWVHMGQFLQGGKNGCLMSFFV